MAKNIGEQKQVCVFIGKVELYLIEQFISAGNLSEWADLIK